MESFPAGQSGRRWRRCLRLRVVEYTIIRLYPQEVVIPADSVYAMTS